MHFYTYTYFEYHKCHSPLLSHLRLAWNAVWELLHRGGVAEPIMKKRLQYEFFGELVCRPFWEYAHRLGHSTVDKYKKLIRLGHTALPERATSSIPPPTPAFATADHWFLQLYLGIGEFSPTEPAQTPLPLDIVNALDIASIEIDVGENDPCCQHCHYSSCGRGHPGIRWWPRLRRYCGRLCLVLR